MDVVSFGETMIRLSPPNNLRLEQMHQLDVNVGGSELNVAVGVSRLGLESRWVSRLPNNSLGRMIRNKAREQGVDTSHIVWSDTDRCGLYFVEYGASPRSSSVLYDRADSAISKIKRGDVDWNKVLAGARVFFVSGITPALSDSAAEVTMDALQAAKKAGCEVVCDLNYRARLWTGEKAREVQTPMMEYVDILSTTEEDTERVFGITAENYSEVAKILVDKFGFKAVTITLRTNLTVLTNKWTAICYADGKVYDDREYFLELVDRVGGGDNYTGGFIYGYLTTGDWEKAVQYGNANSALKQTIPGDLNWATLADVEKLVKGGSGLRIAR